MTGAVVGRPRDAAVTQRVTEAALALFSTSGYAQVTMADVAREASVGLDTIYRRWPSKQALVVDVVSSAVADAVRVPDTGSIEGDLLQLLLTLATTVRGDLGPVIATALGEAAHDPQLLSRLATAHRQRRDATSIVFTRAVDRGELSADVDVDLVLDLLNGIVWHRVFVSDVALPETDVRAVVALLLAGLDAPH